MKFNLLAFAALIGWAGIVLAADTPLTPGEAPRRWWAA
jgi:hypothetical protein